MIAPPLPPSSGDVTTIASLVDLAQAAGTSVSTASRALSGHSSVNEKTRLRIQKLADAHGFQPNRLARNLRLQRTQSIGLVLPLGHEAGQHLSDPFFLSLLGHLADGLTERGYDLVLSRVIPHDGTWLDRLVDSGRIDGLILIGQSDQSAVIDKVAARYAPIVVWGARLPGQRYLTVGSDNRLGGARAAEHLIAIGRRRLLYLGNASAPEFAERLAGFQDAVSRAGPGVAAAALDLHMTPDAAHLAIAKYLTGHPAPDAIFAASDVVAMSALRALRERGLSVPQDVAVVGYDDVTLAAHTAPALTTIRQDLVVGAKALIEILFRRIAGEPAQSLQLDPQLIVRGSSVA
ncbi:LacI family DNA-binding transcriptional regulator [Sphingomonas echinoides]|jgi:DNA-binding LacI/PurR family transcriptional regulator|uniref:Substrate-binding domain-containing protein n=1 Tax=Sphingomonas echinoides TaxID=59803 RepID=A0ABU4PNF7_9SPHN|nr:substrate-binding domain-containing protein [Sphingomonas echinoides]MDX5985180.1 substrate-binding domain-containing protein [Sphingomonas echinoides]